MLRNSVSYGYGMSLRDASLTIIFFNILTALPVAYMYVDDCIP